MFEIYGNEPLKQWQKNRKLIVDDLNIGDQVRFSNKLCGPHHLFTKVYEVSETKESVTDLAGRVYQTNTYASGSALVFSEELPFAPGQVWKVSYVTTEGAEVTNGFFGDKEVQQSGSSLYIGDTSVSNIPYCIWNNGRVNVHTSWPNGAKLAYFKIACVSGTLVETVTEVNKVCNIPNILLTREMMGLADDWTSLTMPIEVYAEVNGKPVHKVLPVAVEHKPADYIYEENTHEAVLFEVTDAEFTVENGTGQYQAEASVDGPLSMDKKYTVVWDGVTYENLIPYISENLTAVGATYEEFISGAPSYPFMIGIPDGVPVIIAMDTTLIADESITTVTHSFSIAKAEEVPCNLNPKWMPEVKSGPLVVEYDLDNYPYVSDEKTRGLIIQAAINNDRVIIVDSTNLGTNYSPFKSEILGWKVIKAEACSGSVYQLVSAYAVTSENKSEWSMQCINLLGNLSDDELAALSVAFPFA